MLAAVVVIPDIVSKKASATLIDFVAAIKDFKRWTATATAQLLGSDGENFWQRDWFDHWSRGPEQDERIKRYIRDNAVKAGLVTNPHDWPYWWQRDSHEK